MINPYIAIKSVLQNDAGKQTALAGGSIWSYWPRTYAVPCIVVEVDKDEEQNDLSGKAPSGMLVSEITITCRGATGPVAWSLWCAVRNALAGQTIGGVDYILDDTADSDTPKSEGSTDHWYDRVMSFTTIRSEVIT